MNLIDKLKYNYEQENRGFEETYNKGIERMCRGIKDNYQVFGFNQNFTYIWGSIRKDGVLEFTFSNSNEVNIVLELNEYTSVSSYEKVFNGIVDMLKLNIKDINKRLEDDMKLQFPHDVYSTVDSVHRDSSSMTRMLECMMGYKNKGVDWN